MAMATVWVIIYQRSFRLQHWAIYVTTDSEFDESVPPVEDWEANGYSDNCGTLYHIVGCRFNFETQPWYSYPLSTRTNIASKTLVSTMTASQNLGAVQRCLENWSPDNRDRGYNCQTWVLDILEHLGRNYINVEREGMERVVRQRGLVMGEEDKTIGTRRKRTTSERYAVD